MNHHGRFNPIRILAALTGLCLLLAAAVDPGLFRLNAPDVTAVGGYSAVDALGQLDTAGEPVYTTFGENNGPNEFGFNRPQAVAMDSVRNRLFVADGENARVMVFDLDGANQLIDRVADHVIGKVDFKDGSVGPTAALMAEPGGLAIDEANGRLFVSDTNNHRVLVFDVSGTITDGQNAMNRLGQDDFTTGTSALPNQNNFTLPQGLAYDSANQRLFTTEGGGVNRVLVFDMTVIVDNEDAINVIGQSTFFSFGSGTTQSTFSNPTHLALDEDGQRLFVGEASNNRVMVFDVDPGTISDGELADNVLGQTSFTSNAGGLGPASLSFGNDFNQPGLAYDPAGDRLFVGDGENLRIMVFAVAAITNGESAVSVLGQTDFTSNIAGPNQSKFGDKPGGLLYDGDNDFLYAPDQYFHRILIFDAAAPITNGDPAVDLLGILDADDNARFDGGLEPDNAPNNRGFNMGEGVALDTVDHRLFVTDYENSRVLVFNLDGSDQLIDHIADNVLGQPTLSDNTAGTTISTMNHPSGIFYRSSSQLFVADQGNNRVLVFDVDTIADGEDAVNVLGQALFTTSAPATTATGMDTPRSIAVDDPGERLFVVDEGNNRVLVYDLHQESPGIDDGEAAVNVFGQTDFTSSGNGTGAGQFDGPYGVAYDPDQQRLFVVDAFSNRVQVFDLSDGIDDGEDAVNTLNSGLELNEVSTGETDPCDDGGTDLQPVFDEVNNRLFVPDICNNRVAVFDTVSIDDGELPVDVVGQADLSSNDAAASQDGLTLPQGLAFNPANNYLYVSDTGSHRVMVFEVPPPVPVATTEHIATDVIGQLTDDEEPLFTNGEADNGPNRRGLNGPNISTIDTVHHRLFLQDGNSNRTLVYDLDISNHLVDRLPDHVLSLPNFKINADELDIPGFTALAYDPVNDLLFGADWSNNRVLVYDVATITGSDEPVHVLGQNDTTGANAGDADFFNDSDCNLTIWGMCRPQGVEYDQVNERLFVASQDQNRVTIYDLSDGIDDGEDAVNVLGQPDFTSDTSNLSQDGSGAAIKVVYDGTRELLYEYDGGNNRVMVWDVDPTTTHDGTGLHGMDGENASFVLGQPDFTTNPGPGLDDSSFGLNYNHSGLAIDTDNQIFYVVDGADNHRVMVFDVDIIVNGEAAVFVVGQPDFTSDDVVVSDSGMNEPWGVSYAADRVYVGDFGSNRVLVYDTTSLSNGVSAVDLLGQLNPDDTPIFTNSKANNGPNTQGLDAPGGVALDTVHHRLFVTDFFNNRILVFALDDGNVLTDRTADFVIGQPDFKSNQSAGGDPQAYNFENGPQSVIYDPANDWLYANDANGNRVLIFDTASISNGMSAAFVLGQPNFTTHDCCSTDASHFVSSEGIALDDPNNRLYVPDGFHNRVLVFDVSTISNGEDAVGVLGQSDFTSDLPGSGVAGMDGPGGATVDVDEQRVFVTDSNNNRILVFDLDDGIDDDITDGEDAVNVLGQDDFSSTGSNLSQSGLSDPRSPLFEGDGPVPLLYVPDTNNNRVMVFDVSTIDDGENASDAYGQTDFVSGDCGTSASELCVPHGVVHDADLDILYVADSGNNRVLVFGPEPSDDGGGGSNNPPTPVGFTPGRIIVNEDDGSTDSRNVLVQVYATTTGNFTGTVDVLLSNTTTFTTFVPFRYVIPERLPNGNNTRDIWPKTIAWDLCFGLTDTTQCRLGNHTVYARFYVNVPAPSPVLVRPDGGNMVSSQ